MSLPSDSPKAPETVKVQGHEDDTEAPSYTAKDEEHIMSFTHDFLDPKDLTRGQGSGSGGESSQANPPIPSFSELLKRANDERESGPSTAVPYEYFHHDVTLGTGDASSEVLRAMETSEDGASTRYSFSTNDGSSVQCDRGQASSARGCLSAVKAIAIQTQGSVRALVSREGKTWKWFSMCLGGADESDGSSGSTARVHILRAQTGDFLDRMEPGLGVLWTHMSKNYGTTGDELSQGELEVLLDGYDESSPTPSARPSVPK